MELLKDVALLDFRSGIVGGTNCVSGGWALKSQNLKLGLISHCLFLLAVDSDVELSGSTPGLRLPVCHHDDDLNL